MASKKELMKAIQMDKEAREEAYEKFFSEAEHKREEVVNRDNPQSEYKKDGEEKKNARLGLLITPTQKKQLEIVSFRTGESINAIIGKLIDNFLKKHKEDIKAGESFLKES